MHKQNASSQTFQEPLIQHMVPLADKNWFRTGGCARLYSEPQSTEQFQHLILYAQKESIPLFIIGQGANILISDEGFNGLVVRPFMNTLEVCPLSTETEAYVKAGSGTTMPDLINFCLDHNIIGLEEFSGIPGTVGGSVYINLHYFNFLLADFLHSAEVLHKTTGHIFTVDNAWFNFGYNESQLQSKEFFLLSATFKLRHATREQTAFAQGRKSEIIRHRAHRYPQTKTCGSFFRNFLPEEVTLSLNDKKIIFVAYYLDKIGIKGQLNHGGALVSHQHANMIINTGNASTNDIITVARTMQELTYNAFGIMPQPECQLIGFSKYPLLTTPFD